jgi:hypothetical protein
MLGEPFSAYLAVSALTVDKEQIPAFRNISPTRLARFPNLAHRFPIKHPNMRSLRAPTELFSARLSVRLSTSPAIH